MGERLTLTKVVPKWKFPLARAKYAPVRSPKAISRLKKIKKKTRFVRRDAIKNKNTRSVHARR